MAFTAQVKGLDAMVTRLSKKKERVQVDARALVDLFLEMARDMIAARTPVAHDFLLDGTEVEGGVTREKWYVRPASGEKNIGAVDHPYNESGAMHEDARGRSRPANKGGFNLLLVLEYGSDPHIIRAKRAPTLRFWWENHPGGAQEYEAKSVNHPGSFNGEFGPGAPPAMVRTTYADIVPKFKVEARNWLNEVFA